MVKNQLNYIPTCPLKKKGGRLVEKIKLTTEFISAFLKNPRYYKTKAEHKRIQHSALEPIIADFKKRYTDKYTHCTVPKTLQLYSAETILRNKPTLKALIEKKVKAALHLYCKQLYT